MDYASKRATSRRRSAMRRFTGGMLAMFLLAAGTAFVVPSTPAVATGKPAVATNDSLFAVVDIAGNLVAGPNVASVTALGTGIREVTFKSNVSGCAFLATTTNAYSQATQAYTASGHLSAKGVYVETKNQGGGLTNAPFNLVVACDGTGVQFAVVGYSANLVRSTSGTTLTDLGSGRYKVTFPSSVKRCAFLATVADPGNGLVFSPAGVYTAEGTTSKAKGKGKAKGKAKGRGAVYVETKNPGGGLQAGVPFHLAAICPSAAKTTPFVVKADGLPARAGKLASSFRASTGNYTLVAPVDVTRCATVATRGSVDTAVPFTPATVEVTPGPAINTVGIQVRALLFFGGGLIDESFHAATVC